MKTFKIILILIVGALLFGCGKDTPPPMPDPVVLPERVVMYANDSSMAIGSVDYILARVFPENAADRSLVWSSSDPSVVSINETGRIEAENEGTAIITVTAKASGVSTSIKVTVESDIKRIRGFLTYEQLSESNMSMVLNIENTSNAEVTLRNIELYHDLQLIEDYPQSSFKQRVPAQSIMYRIYSYTMHSAWMSGLNTKVFFRMNDQNYAMTVYRENFHTELVHEFSVGIDPEWGDDSTYEIP